MTSEKMLSQTFSLGEVVPGDYYTGMCDEHGRLIELKPSAWATISQDQAASEALFQQLQEESQKRVDREELRIESAMVPSITDPIPHKTQADVMNTILRVRAEEDRERIHQDSPSQPEPVKAQTTPPAPSVQPTYDIFRARSRRSDTSASKPMADTSAPEAVAAEPKETFDASLGMWEATDVSWGFRASAPHVQQMLDREAEAVDLALESQSKANQPLPSATLPEVDWADESSRKIEWRRRGLCALAQNPALAVGGDAALSEKIAKRMMALPSLLIQKYAPDLSQLSDVDQQVIRVDGPRWIRLQEPTLSLPSIHAILGKYRKEFGAHAVVCALRSVMGYATRHPQAAIYNLLKHPFATSAMYGVSRDSWQSQVVETPWRSRFTLDAASTGEDRQPEKMWDAFIRWMDAVDAWRPVGCVTDKTKKRKPSAQTSSLGPKVRSSLAALRQSFLLRWSRPEEKDSAPQGLQDCASALEALDAWAAPEAIPYKAPDVTDMTRARRPFFSMLFEGFQTPAMIKRYHEAFQFSSRRFVGFPAMSDEQKTQYSHPKYDYPPKENVTMGELYNFSSRGHGQYGSRALIFSDNMTGVVF